MAMLNRPGVVPERSQATIEAGAHLSLLGALGETQMPLWACAAISSLVQGSWCPPARLGCLCCFQEQQSRLVWEVWGSARSPPMMPDWQAVSEPDVDARAVPNERRSEGLFL